MDKFLTFETLASYEKVIDACLETDISKIPTFKTFIYLNALPSSPPKIKHCSLML